MKAGYNRVAADNVFFMPAKNTGRRHFFYFYETNIVKEQQHERFFQKYN